MTNVQKYMLGVGLAAVLMVGGASLAMAEDMPKPTAAMMPGERAVAKEMVLEIGARGNVLMRGTVSVVGTNSLTVKSWGGDWMVNVSSSTQLMPMAVMSQFAVGDFVGVQGTVNTGAAWTIDAKLVRDWSAKKEAQDTRKEIQDMMKISTPKNWQGVAGEVNAAANTFMLTIDGTAYTVNLATGAKVVNQGYVTMNLADIKSGDTVRIYATVSGSTATALVVRDIGIAPTYNVQKSVPK